MRTHRAVRKYKRCPPATVWNLFFKKSVSDGRRVFLITKLEAEASDGAASSAFVKLGVNAVSTEFCKMLLVWSTTKSIKYSFFNHKTKIGEDKINTHHLYLKVD